MSADVPFIEIGENELGKPLGTEAKCPSCGAWREIKRGVDTKTGEESNALQFLTCCGRTVLIGINGREIERAAN